MLQYFHAQNIFPKQDFFDGGKTTLITCLVRKKEKFSTHKRKLFNWWSVSVLSEIHDVKPLIPYTVLSSYCSWHPFYTKHTVGLTTLFLTEVIAKLYKKQKQAIDKCPEVSGQKKKCGRNVAMPNMVDKYFSRVI